MVTRRDFLKQIGKAAVGGAMFAAGAARIKPSYRGGITSEPKARKTLRVPLKYPNCQRNVRTQGQTLDAHRCLKIDVQVIDFNELCEMLDRNKQGIAEIIQTGKLNGRKVFYQVDHKMGPSWVPLSPIS